MKAIPAPITKRIDPRRQDAARHYGAHPYFTRRAWNVVQAYIRHFTTAGDLVMDPFGGSGVTAVESLILRRRAIHVDINPLANFVTEQVAVAPVSLGALSEAFENVKRACHEQLALWRSFDGDYFSEHECPYWYPKRAPLPKNADAKYVADIFTPRQLFVLSLILDRINGLKSRKTRDLLRFCFSATLAKTNRTFVSARNRAASRGGPTILSVYRYNVPKSPVELDPWTQFEERFGNLIRCKEETNKGIGEFYSKRNCRIIQGDAANLRPAVGDESVDYIFTDPPYGAHIAYLDLSTMWNAWLGFKISSAERDAEVIEGGDKAHSRAHYLSLLAKSISEMHRVLKHRGWLSLVFEHRDGTLYSEIVRAAEAAGLNYVNAVSQSTNVIWSMHKKKNPMKVLSGELILNFQKSRESIDEIPAQGDALDVPSLILDVAEQETRNHHGARSEDIYNHVMVRLLDAGQLHHSPVLLNDVFELLVSAGYAFDKATGRWRRSNGQSSRSAYNLFQHR